MIANWLYNQIADAATKEKCLMTLDFVLNKISKGTQFTLADGRPEAVSTISKLDFYVKPSLKDMHTTKDSKLILFSAPGATGKSALATFIAYEKNALLWDLSKERIANHSLSGMLVKALGTKHFSAFTEGLTTGKALLVIDALDEAEMISGRIALETLLADLRDMVKDGQAPTVILCARTETAHFIRQFYSSDENKLPMSQYEIGFFEESNAKEFITKKIAKKHTITPAIDECIGAQFTQIKRILEGDSDLVHSFIGYAPVLEALAVFFDEERNTMQLLRQTESAKNSTEIFVKIMDYILERERKKVINGFEMHCRAEYPDFVGWDTVYTEEEQLVRISYYLILDSVDYENYPLNLPRELEMEYGQLFQSFLKDHPFVHCFEAGEVYTDFAGPAFRDYVLAKLMTMDGYDDFAKEYFSEHKGNTRVPSQLFFDFYEYFAHGEAQSSHFPYLYDAFKSKETASTISSVSIEEIDGVLFCSFINEKKRKDVESIKSVTEFVMTTRAEGICISQLNNAYVDVTEDLILGTQNEEVVINNSTVKCKRLVINSPCVLLMAYSKGETLISCTEGIDTSRCPTAKFEIRVDRVEALKVSTPDVNSWFKLRPHYYKLDDETNLDIVKFENAVKTILKHFRKHGKDASGRHREFIENIIVGGSALKRQVLNFFEDRGIIYCDDKDPSQFKLNKTKLEELGVNWGLLSQNSSPNMLQVFEAYCKWEEKA